MGKDGTNHAEKYVFYHRRNIFPTHENICGRWVGIFRLRTKATEVFMRISALERNECTSDRMSYSIPRYCHDLE
jgi:hypothetical protein